MPFHEIVVFIVQKSPAVKLPMLVLLSADFFQDLLIFKYILTGTLSECLKVWIQTKTHVLSVLVWD